MSKPKPIRVICDDCTVTIGEVEYHPHEDEWVEIVPGLRVGDFAEDIRLMALQAEYEAVRDDAQQGPAKALEVSQLMADFYRRSAGLIAKRLYAWNWTDDDGKPLAQPHLNEAVILSLRSEEVGYLLGVLRGNRGSDSKNG